MPFEPYKKDAFKKYSTVACEFVAVVTFYQAVAYYKNKQIFIILRVKMCREG
jgi:hypothetical protein